LASNFGIRFEEPNDTFGWTPYGVNQLDDLQGRAEMLEPFDVGRRVETSHLFARHTLATPASKATLRKVEDLPLPLAEEVRKLAGGLLPDLDQGNHGLVAHMHTGADAARLLGVARGWRMDPALKADAEAMEFNPDRHVVLTSLETGDEPELTVYRVDRLTLKVEEVGVDMNFLDDTQALLEMLVPESLDAASGEYNGFSALFQLLKDAERLDIGGAADGIDEDFKIDHFQV
jgi:hypothetical protein